MRISDWSSDVCSSDLSGFARRPEAGFRREAFAELPPCTAVLCNPWRSNTRSLVPRVETRPRRARSSLCPGCLARRFGLGLLTGAFEVGLRVGLEIGRAHV